MSTSDTASKRLGPGDFKRLLPSHPGIVWKLQKPVTCEGFMATGFSFKKRREGRLPACKNPAYWTFRPLKTWHEKPPIQHFCWSHLIYRGVYGSMEEEARTFRWLRRLGYVVEFEYEDR